MREHHLRSIVKGTSWRIFGTLATAGIIFIFTGNIGVSLKVGAVEFVTKIFIYYLHERIWHKVPWGVSHHNSRAVE